MDPNLTFITVKILKPNIAWKYILKIEFENQSLIRYMVHLYVVKCICSKKQQHYSKILPNISDILIVEVNNIVAV